MSAAEPVERATTFLFVPGNRPDRFARAASSGADLVIIDLEDAVAFADKKTARRHAAAWLAAGEKSVIRVNAVSTPWHDDDIAIAQQALAVMLPKTETTADLTYVKNVLGDVPLIPLLETPRGVLNAEALCAADGVTRVAFGHVDFAAATGLDPDNLSALAGARSQLVYASAASGRATPIDGVTTAINDEGRLRGDTLNARSMGFGAKLLIHPVQVHLVEQLLRPTEDEISWAESILRECGDGVGVHDGQMIDAPVIARARRLMARNKR